VTPRRFLGGILGVVGVALATHVKRVEVAGESMRPALEPGDRLVILRPWRRPRPAPGTMVAVSDPRNRRRTVVKRVVRSDRHTVTVAGDNASASTDSRHFGPVAITEVKGLVVYRYGPESRRGRVAVGQRPGAPQGAGER